MKNIICVLICSLVLTACSNNSAIDYPENTVLGLRPDAIPDYYMCSSLFSMGRRCIEEHNQELNYYVISIPEKENTLPFEITSVITMYPNVMSIIFSPFTEYEEVKNYYESTYAPRNSLGNLGTKDFRIEGIYENNNPETKSRWVSVTYFFYSDAPFIYDEGRSLPEL